MESSEKMEKMNPVVEHVLTRCNDLEEELANLRDELRCSEE